jgi:hypothetical protein
VIGRQLDALLAQRTEIQIRERRRGRIPCRAKAPRTLAAAAIQEGSPPYMDPDCPATA